MANIDDLTELEKAFVFNLGPNDARVINSDGRKGTAEIVRNVCEKISNLSKDKKAILANERFYKSEDNESDICIKKVTHISIEDCSKDETENTDSSDEKTDELFSTNEALLSTDDSSTSSESTSPIPQFVEQNKRGLSRIVESSRLVNEDNIEKVEFSPTTRVTNDKTRCIDDIIISKEQPFRDNITKEIDNSSKCDENILKEKFCFEETTITAREDTALLLNNNFAQTTNKTNEIVQELNDNAECNFDTVSPLTRKCSIGVKKKSRSNLAIGGRRVSFPKDDASLITSYLEPVNPWDKMLNIDNEIIATAYRTSCELHGACALPTVVMQISAFPLLVGDRIQCLNFYHQKLDSNQCECLEEIFKRVQFKRLNFEACGLDDDSAIALFDMIEFYDSATQLNISCNSSIGFRGWQAFAKMLKKSKSINLLDAHNTDLSEQTVHILARTLRADTKLQTLHLENCNLNERALSTLSGALRVNDSLKELYLADNRIGPKDCIFLEYILFSNFVLKTLDLRNNNIQDEGCSILCKGITTQQGNILTFPEASKQIGLENLILWNNHITIFSAPAIADMLTNKNSLESLNLGKNNLTTDGVIALRAPLMKNNTLKNLGLQATKIGDEGVIAIAETLENNTVEWVDVRGNNVHLAGMNALASVVEKAKTNIIKIDVDSNPGFVSDEARFFIQLKRRIEECCRKNHTRLHSIKDKIDSFDIVEFRKMSLTCESSIHPPVAIAEIKKYFSPEPSPSSSPSPSPIPSPVNSRFRVCKVDSTTSTSSNPHNVLSSSAPAVLTMPPSIDHPNVPVTRVITKNRFSSSRFTVIPITDGFKLPVKALSVPTLNLPSTYYKHETISSTRNIAVETFMPQSDCSPSDDVFLDTSDILKGKNSLIESTHILKAPLAAMEGESFDTDSEDTEALSEVKLDKEIKTD